MRGIRSISEELSAFVDAMPAADLPQVILFALPLVRKVHHTNALIVRAVDQYLASPGPDMKFAQLLAKESARTDRQYIQADERGLRDKADQLFDEMGTLHGLSTLYQAEELSLAVVDDIIYDLGHGANDIDAFGDVLLELLTRD